MDSQPTFSASSNLLNFYPQVTYNGTSQFMKFTTLPGAGDYDVFAVANVNSTAAFSPLLGAPDVALHEMGVDAGGVPLNSKSGHNYFYRYPVNTLTANIPGVMELPYNPLVTNDSAVYI